MRRHYEVLDGLRGVAAMGVLMLHLAPDRGVNLVPHGALAVDFFFVLSGFVVASAYERRLVAGWAFRDFMRTRAIRLYPLVLAGAILGAIGQARDYSPGVLAGLFLTGALLLPTPLGRPDWGPTLIPVNPPSWSLFLEVLANAAYALFARHLTNARLVAGIMAAALCLLASGYSGDTLSVGNLWPGGWAGAPRVAFSFLAGIGLFRLRDAGRFTRIRVPAMVPAVLLCAAMAVPILPAANLLYESIVVFALFPLIVLLGANAASGRLAGFCVWFGAVSYPLYVLQGGIVPHLRGLPDRLHQTGLGQIAVTVASALAFLLFAAIAEVLDRRFRRWLPWRGNARSAQLAPTGPRPATS